MPGTILVSVLELADLPAALASTSSIGGNGDVGFTVKVSFGKTEYQTRGEEELSFPVLSLRDNLVVRLHDAEKVVISQAVVKTMQLVEKGLWDAWFELEGGGRVHMKLHFLLNDNERKRIRYMRESARKRKITSQPYSSGVDSYSGDSVFLSNSKDATELLNKVDILSHRQKIAPEADNDQLIGLSDQDLKDSTTQQSDSVTSVTLLPISDHHNTQASLNEDSKSTSQHSEDSKSTNQHSDSVTSASSIPISGPHDIQASINQDDDPQLSDTTPLVSENCELASSSGTGGLLKDNADAILCDSRSSVSENDKLPPPSPSNLDNYDMNSTKRKSYTKRSQLSSVKNMVSAFETRLSQEKGLNSTIQTVKRYQLRKAESTGSLKGISSEKSQSGSVVSNHANNPISSCETIVKSFSEGKLSLMGSEQSLERSKLIPQVAEDGKNNFSPDNKDEILPKIVDNLGTKKDIENMDREYLESTNNDIPLDSACISTCHETTDVCNPLQRLQTASSVGIQEITTTLRSSPAFSEESAPDAVRKELVDKCNRDAFRQASSTESNNRSSITDSISQSFLEGSIGEQQFGLTVVSMLDAPSFREESNESSSTTSTELHSSREHRQLCILGYPNIWMKRRPCITTAPKQLMDIIGDDDFCAEANFSEDSFINLDRVKEDIEDFAQVIPKHKMFSCKPSMMQKQNRWLLEQAVRVVIVIVACGTLVLNSGTM